MRNHKFRLYPSKEQEKKLLWTLDRCRFTYNKLLEGMNKQEKINKNALQHSLVNLKKQYPELQNVHSKTLQYENWRLFSNLRGLSQLKRNGKKVGRLRFKSYGSFKTFVYNQTGFKFTMTGNRFDILKLSKIGELKMRIGEGQNIPTTEIKQIIVKRHGSGKWFAILCSDEPNHILEPTGKQIGIDVGLTNFITDSDGLQIENPKFYKKTLARIKKEQRNLSRKKKGSMNRLKQKAKLARFHGRIENQRDDFIHKISRYYVNNYDVICYEKLTIRNMVRNHNLAQGIMDASWGKLINMVVCKADSAGRRQIAVDPRGTTQNCANCGNAVYKGLADRWHECSCGFAVHRDYNSAVNILRQGLSEVTPLENRPLHELARVPASQFVELGSPHALAVG
jgi:putative transposase